MSGPVSRIPHYEDIVGCDGKVGEDILYKRVVNGVESICYVDSNDGEEVCHQKLP